MLTELDIPIHAFDLIIADECHRGYTAPNSRSGATRWTISTPSSRPDRHAGGAHHGLLRGHRLSLRVRAAPSARAIWSTTTWSRSSPDVRINGVFLKEGDRSTSRSRDRRAAARPTRRRTAVRRGRSRAEDHVTRLEPQDPRGDSKRYADEHEQRHGRFPKTLIFAANDLPHTSHADQLVDRLPRRFRPRRPFRRRRSPATVDRPLQRIREFRNRPDARHRRDRRSDDDRRRHPGSGVHRLPAPV